MKTSIYIITIFFLLLAGLLANQIATANIPLYYDLKTACYPLSKPTGKIELTSDNITVECRHSKSGELGYQVVRL